MFFYAAYLAVGGAIACTLWVNGSYAWSLGGEGLYHRVAVTVISVAIDLAKCGFLAAARVLWQSNARAPAFVLVVLWMPALAYSTFAGFSYLTTTRTIARASDEAAEGNRARAQVTYAAATELLTQAKASPLWQASAGCTAVKRDHRDFCARVAQAITDQRASSKPLDTLPVVHANPEITSIAAATGYTMSTVQLIVSLAPAVLVELIASLGAYALQGYSKPSTREAPAAVAQSVSEVVPTNSMAQAKTSPAVLQTPHNGADATRPLKWGSIPAG